MAPLLASSSPRASEANALTVHCRPREASNPYGVEFEPLLVRQRTNGKVADDIEAAPARRTWSFNLRVGNLF